MSLELLVDVSTPVDLVTERAVAPTGRGTVLIVAAGAVDVFAVPLAASRPDGRWTYLCRVGVGAILPTPPRGPRNGIVCRPVPGSRLVRIPVTDLQRLTRQQAAEPGGLAFDDRLSLIDQGNIAHTIVAGIEQVIAGLAQALSADLPPRDFQPLALAETSLLARGDVGRPVDGICWVEIESGAVKMSSGLAGVITGGADRFCLTTQDWLVAESDTRLRARSTQELLEDGTLWRALAVHAGRSMYALDRWMERRDNQEQATLVERQRQDTATLGGIARGIDTVLHDADARIRLADVAHDPPALAAFRLVAEHSGFELVLPPGVTSARRQLDPVMTIAVSAGVHIRRIRLSPRWWRRELGPMIGYRRADQAPVALLPVGRGYAIVEDGVASPLTMEGAATLARTATVVYRPLPADVHGIRALLRFGLHGTKSDRWMFSVLALVISVLGLIVPVMTGAVLGTFVSRGERGLVVQGSLAVIGAALVIMILSVVQNLAVLRLASRTTATMQIGVFTKLLSLPAPFFARYSIGELATAVLGVNAAQEALSGLLISAILGLLAGSANLVLVYLLDLQLALLATALVSLGMLFGVLAGRRELRWQRQLYQQNQVIASRTFQLLNAVPKLRVAAAEERAFGVWSRDFVAGRALVTRARKTQNMVINFNAVYPILCSAVIFTLVGVMTDSISVPTFLAFFSSFSLLLAAILQFTAAGVTALAIVPMLENVEPVLRQPAESTGSGAQPGDLSGRINLEKVSFRYGDDGPLALDNVSIAIEPGEFVALVGPSGSGKSTILRILLGFARPSGGGVFYDGQDLTELDLPAVRRQCGIVLQNSGTLAGSIKDAIIGGTKFTIDDAWTAVRMVGLDKDIEAMPMGMSTVISDGASAFSGGQRQRLLIARALVNRPRIVFFDEATSALDNPTQQIVAESTHRLNCTRVVIAHRISTVAQADRIIVLDQGKVMQEGTYQQLIEDTDGLFARLAKRQR